ncbi:Asp-tRNA(Asn)/Glu-tRNA(Gln) amidotransferase subunit GatA [Candidatus Uhrbacteria bacterium]|nr:Asp-tRNA(Asn)/Glu-tRNA(Gln) amidotransferase subunit GatA [Candidatus Uhrbacteria bacterium]
MTDMAHMTIAEAGRLFRAKRLSSRELTQACLDRIAMHDPSVHAFLEISETALAEADAADARLASGEELPPLAGIPLGIKSIILVKGLKATAGSRILEDYQPPYDATAVERLRRAGAVFLGMTNMDEFAMGSSTENSAFGPTKNPWNLERVPGGTSGGSAAAVAAGFVPGALGSDTGGSVRQPAALCGVVGLKPTYGRVSRYGLIAAASSLDNVGPLARTVEDTALLFQTIHGRDPRDATSSSEAAMSPISSIPSDVNGLRLGIPKEYFVEGMDADIRASVMDAVETLKRGGAEVCEVSLPHAEYALAAFYIIVFCEESSNLSRFDGMRYGHSAPGKDLLETYMRTRGEAFGPEPKRRIMLGSYALSKGYYDAYYKKALQVRQLIRRDFEEAFKDVDAIVTPTSPSVAWKLGEKVDDPLTMYLSDIYTISANLAGIPGMSVPCGFVQNLPVGLQLMGRPFDEATLFRLGMHYQSVTDWHLRRPTLA